jgi:hypothetical protein
MNNKKTWLLLLLPLFATIIFYFISNKEIQASILFFGTLILICLVAGVIIASILKSIFKNL